MRRFILLMLLAWLPVQASAMPWLAVKCEQHESGTYGHAAHNGGNAHHGDPASSSGSNEDGHATADGVHTSCHHFFSGAIHGVADLTDAVVATGLVSHPPAPLYEFLPDLPKRPPLADLV